MTIDTVIREEGIPFGEVISAHMSSDKTKWWVAYHADCAKEERTILVTRKIKIR